jgi:hypothetical protein
MTFDHRGRLFISPAMSQYVLVGIDEIQAERRPGIADGVGCE